MKCRCSTHALVCSVVGLTAALCIMACAAHQSDSDSGNTAVGSGGATSMTHPSGGFTMVAGGSATAAGGSGSTTATTVRFSFFVTSYKILQELSGNTLGFGGDLRYGETGDGAGLRGADKMCTEIAERSMRGNGKTWRAFLSTSTVSAIDRIGEGPWYDRLGRVFAMKKADLLATRPVGADTAIVNDLPNEDGVLNQSPEGTAVDNHDFLTGSNHNGTLFSRTAACSDWTSSAADTSAKPRVGHSWPGQQGGGGPGGGRGAGGATSTSASNTPGMQHWLSALDESGCAPGVNLIQNGGPGNDGGVGSGGGYGGWYCFALTP